MSELRLTLRQPAQLGDRARSDAVLGTTQHVPGMVVRGALAGAWIARYGAPTRTSARRDEFVELFEGGVRFGPLFSGEPFPSLALLEHKYRASDACAHDDLDEVEHPDAPSSCPDCGSPWVLRSTLRDEQDDRRRIAVRRRTSVVIGESGVGVQGGLFSRDTLSPGRDDGSAATFTGHLVARDQRSVEALNELQSVRIGGRRTTHGLADLAIVADPNVELPQQVDDRTIVLRLRSPAVFVDLEGRPTPTPGPHHLEAYLGPDAQVTRAWYRWQTIGGWHAASGLPKPGELAITPGSTYLVTATRPVTAADLSRLANDGVGLRRHEGFGDLGRTAMVRPGRIAREAEVQRLRAAATAVAALRGLSANPRVWAVVRALLEQHAAGDSAAGARLIEVGAKVPDQRVVAALNRLMAYPPSDILAVLKDWT